MKTGNFRFLAFVAMQMASLFAASNALAHHPMGGAMPDSAMEGLLSGLGHPIIEAGHLIFLLSAALVAAIYIENSRKAMLPLAGYVSCSSIGVMLGIASESFTMVELGVGITLLVMALCLWRSEAISLRAGGAIAVLAGLVHGMAYAEAVVGAEPTPILAYLLGLTMIQTAVVIVAFLIFQWTMKASPRLIRVSRHALATAACVMGVSLAVLPA